MFDYGPYCTIPLGVITLCLWNNASFESVLLSKKNDDIIIKLGHNV